MRKSGVKRMITDTQMEQIINRLKLLIPYLETPKDSDGKGFLTAMFRNLNANIVNKVLTDLTEEQLNEIRKSPFANLKKLVIQQTEFDEREKQEYKNNLEIDWTRADLTGYMWAYTKNGARKEELDRPMTAIEEDYILYDLMTDEEYLYYIKKTDIKPANCVYDMINRTCVNLTQEQFERNQKTKREVLQRREWEGLRS